MTSATADVQTARMSSARWTICALLFFALSQ